MPFKKYIVRTRADICRVDISFNSLAASQFLRDVSIHLFVNLYGYVFRLVPAFVDVLYQSCTDSQTLDIVKTPNICAAIIWSFSRYIHDA